MERLENKWISTAASILIQCFTGATLTFSIYSSVLKSSQGYNQSELDLISVFKDIGDNGGIVAGLLYTVVSASKGWFSGAWMVHLLGSIQCFTGYFLIWACVSGLVSPPPLLVMCLYMLLASHAQPFFDTANIVSGVQNFPNHRGAVVGIMKGFQGLSAAILIQVYNTLCKGKPSTFILILALLPTLVSLFLMCLVRRCENSTQTQKDKKYLNGFCAIAMITASYLMVIIILDHIFKFTLWALIVTLCILLVLLASPLCFAIVANSKQSTEKDLEEEKASNNQEQEQDMNLKQATRTLNFWLLFICMLCGRGSGLATINNLRQVGESLNYKSTEINMLVSLWSIWNFIGRFGAGFLSDILLYSRKWARPLLMAITLAIMTVGHIIIASGFHGNLGVATFLVGVGNGSIWSLMPAISSEIFGIKHMGTIFNSIAIASPIGTYILSVRVIGYLYDKEVSSGRGHGRNLCSGSHCFRLSFLIMASATLFGFLVTAALFFRTRSFYKLVVLKRLLNS